MEMLYAWLWWILQLFIGVHMCVCLLQITSHGYGKSWRNWSVSLSKSSLQNPSCRSMLEKRCVCKQKTWHCVLNEWLCKQGHHYVQFSVWGGQQIQILLTHYDVGPCLLCVLHTLRTLCVGYMLLTRPKGLCLSSFIWKNVYLSEHTYAFLWKCFLNVLLCINLYACNNIVISHSKDIKWRSK